MTNCPEFALADPPAPSRRSRTADLVSHLTDANKAGFSWGVHDCFTWAMDWLARRTGRDPGAELRGAYASQAGAARILLAEGGYPQLIERLLGPCELGAPRVGDLVLVELEPGLPTLGVCIGGRFAFLAERGVITVKARSDALVWRVD